MSNICKGRVGNVKSFPSLQVMRTYSSSGHAFGCSNFPALTMKSSASTVFNCVKGVCPEKKTNLPHTCMHSLHCISFNICTTELVIGSQVNGTGKSVISLILTTTQQQQIMLNLLPTLNKVLFHSILTTTTTQ